MVLLAAYSILRIIRSELRNFVELQRGEESYFNAIKFVKKRSAENNDLDARNGTIMTQLWCSNKAFRQKDGTLNGLELRLRGRLVSLLIAVTKHLTY